MPKTWRRRSRSRRELRGRLAGVGIFGADRDDLFYRERDAPRAQPLDDRR
jgi:hypothetical protein